MSDFQQKALKHLGLDSTNPNFSITCSDIYDLTNIQAGYDICQKEYEEKLRWIPTIEQTPTATEIGDWDGKRSDFVLAKTKNGSHYILRVYEGFSNGEKMGGLGR